MFLKTDGNLSELPVSDYSPASVWLTLADAGLKMWSCKDSPAPIVQCPRRQSTAILLIQPLEIPRSGVTFLEHGSISVTLILPTVVSTADFDLG